MLSFIENFNHMMFVFFTIMYFYQIVYVLVALIFRKNRPVYPNVKKLHRYAVVIAARNESAVIEGLIASVKKQKYPSNLIDIFVVADNCSDNTAAVARAAGAIVYERFNNQLVGKGHALSYILNIIENSYGDKGYEGFFVFDADNLLDENYVSEMNKVFDCGYKVITSYRNSKNYSSNWISAGYSLWFLREAEYLNNPRMLLKTSCAISGTGFLIHRDIVRKNHGWKYHLLTEDIEFSVDSVIHEEVIGYCGTAIIYDEQPCTFSQSWDQRLRWSKGFYQVFGKYGVDLVKSLFCKKKNRFASFDMFMTIMPALFISLTSIAVNGLFLLIGITYNSELIQVSFAALTFSFVNFYIFLYAIGLLTTITEWKHISCRPSLKLLYTFSFPIFIFTYIPISIVALFKKVEWTPIQHTVVKSLEQVR